METKGSSNLPKVQTYQAKPKQYCCLYHYLQGKKTKGLTPCNNHVSLGVINPLTTLTPSERQKIKSAKISEYDKNLQNNNLNLQNLVVNAGSFDLNFHTHFINEIQKKGSMPIQLIKPRIYVQKILRKNQLGKNKSFLYPMSQNKKQFIEIFNLYKQFALKTKFATEKQLKDDIMRFSRQKNIKTTNFGSMASIMIDKSSASQYLFSKEDFINYLISHSFSQQYSENFWQAAYNKDRFLVPQRTQSNLARMKSDFVSMKAFTYNFRKFYLEEEEYYKNVFSQPAFRQRLIDLRLTLELWFHKNIILKNNMKKWKKTELQLAEFLKKSGYQKEFQILIKLIEDRNRITFLMRTIAKCFYTLTDQKNFGMDVWNNRVTYLIEQKSDSLICFMDFIQKFKDSLTQQQIQAASSSPLKNLKITDLIQFLNNNKNIYGQLEQSWIIKWIRNIYKYLYFYKDAQELQIDTMTLKLSCKAQVSIQKQLIQQFIHFKSNETDACLEVLTSLTEEIEQKMNTMPELQGVKKYLVQCNYLTQTLLRIIKRNDFSSFQTLHSINKIVEDHWFDFQNCCDQIVQIIRISYGKDQINPIDDKFWKQLFTLQKDHKQNINATSSEQSIGNYTYKDALHKYQNVKHALGILPSQSNQLANTNVKKSGLVDKKTFKKGANNLPNKASQFMQKLKKQKEQLTVNVEQFDWNLNYRRHEQYNCSQGYCSLCQDMVSTQISSTISKVEDMESYLMNLLRDV